MKHLSFRAVLLILALAPAGGAVAADPPRVVRPWLPADEARVRMPDGTVKKLYLAKDRTGGAVTSTDGGNTWPTPAEPGFQWASKAFLDRDGQLHGFVLKLRQEQPGRRIAVDRFLDVWHFRTAGPDRTWQKATMIEKGWNGSLVAGAVQLPGGRIVQPAQNWTPHSKPGPPTGNGYVEMLYSDDGGSTWQSSNPITSPAFDGYNGANFGACEACILVRNDNTLWALMRTQTGVLFESFSQDGAVWSEGKPTSFHSSNSPASFLRLPDNLILLVWNNCEMPDRFEGAGVYGGRDALHAAISSDDGKTWRGFREVSLYPERHQSPPKKGDRGMAYPHASLAADGKHAEVTAGHGKGRALIEIDPDWLLEKERAEDFSAGLENWTVFKSFGPAERWWRDREPGAVLVDAPEKPGAKALHLRKPDDKDADGAVWNFPAGRSGSMKMRLRFAQGQQGARINLADRFFEPADGKVDAKAVFGFSISPDGQLEGSDYRFPADRWVNVELRWNDENGSCEIFADGTPVATIPRRNNSVHGVSYLHLRSLAKTVDPAGFLLGNVRVSIQ